MRMFAIGDGERILRCLARKIMRVSTSRNRDISTPLHIVKRKEVRMLERQGLHFIEEQHGACQRGKAAHITARSGKERVKQLHHSAANNRRAIPAAVPCEIYVQIFLSVRNEIRVVLENTVITESFADALHVLPFN